MEAVEPRPAPETPRLGPFPPPAFTPPEEVGQIEYFLAQLASLQDRGLLAAEVAETVRREYTERRTQLVQEAERQARLARAAEWERTAPERAAAEYEYLLTLEPGQPNLYRRLVLLYERLQRLEEALRVCEARAADDEALAHRAAELRERVGRRQRIQQLEAALGRARAAGEASAILAVCQALLAEEPAHPLALETRARTQAQQGDLERAREAYDDLLAAHPQHPRRGQWAQERGAIVQRQARQRAEEERRRREEEAARRAAARRAHPSWVKVIVQEHPEHIAIGLGILLLIVAGAIWATINRERVGAWAIYAPAFALTGAIFGFGFYLLVRADRRSAGELLFIGTACLVPINGLLIGELHLLQLPHPLDLGIGVAGLLAMAWLTVFIAGHWERQGMGLFAPPFLLLTALQVVLDHDSPFPFPQGTNLILLYVGALALLAGVVNVNLRLKAPTRVGRREFLGFGLGLMLYAYALLSLRLHVWFDVSLVHYAPLLALAAMAIFHTAHCSPRLFDEPKMSQLVPLGYVALGLGWAIALVNYQQSIPLLFATSVLAALTCAALVWQYRQPFHLYAAFVTGGVAYGLWPLIWREVAELISVFMSGLLGFHGEPLPLAFKGLNLFWASLFLLWLACRFERRQDRQLVIPCHIVGVPLSLLALGLAVGHPQAACLTFLDYAALYAIAAGRWPQPALVCVAAGLASGSLYAAGLWWQWPVPAQGLALAGLAFVWLSLSVGLRPRVGESYADPLTCIALGLSVVPLFFGLTNLLNALSVLSLWLVAGLYLWAARLTGAVPLSYLGLASVTLGGSGLVTLLGLTFRQPGFGLLALAWAWLCYLGGEVLLRFVVPVRSEARSGRGVPTPDVDGTPHRSVPDYKPNLTQLYAWPLINVSLALAAVGLGLTALEMPFGPHTVAALTLACALAATATRVYPTPLLTYLAALAGVVSAVVVCELMTAVHRFIPCPCAAGFSVLALALYLTSDFGFRISDLRTSRTPHSALRTPQRWDRLYRRPLAHSALALSLVALSDGVYWWGKPGLWGEPGLIASAFALTALLYWLAASLYPTPILAYATLAAGATAMVQFATALGLLPSLSEGALLAAVAALTLWSVGLWCRRGVSTYSHTPTLPHSHTPTPRRLLFAEPCLVSALVVSVAALGLSVAVAVMQPAVAPFGIAALLLTALLYVLATLVYPETILTHAAMACVTAATAWVLWPVERFVLAANRWEVLGWGGLGLATIAWMVARVIAVRSQARSTSGVPPPGADDTPLRSVPDYQPDDTPLRSVPDYQPDDTPLRSVPDYQPDPLYAQPLYLDALLLGIVAVVLGCGNAAALTAAALLFLLPLWSHPSAHWLYASLLLGVGAAFLGVWPGVPEALRSVTLVGVALGLWLAGLGLMSFQPGVARALHLTEQPYDQPFYHVALGLAVVSTLWCAYVLSLAQAWLTPPGMELATIFLLGLFWTLMIRAYPHAEWLYAAAGMFSYGLWVLGLATLRGLGLDPVSAGALALLLLGYLWMIGGRVLESVGPFVVRYEASAKYRAPAQTALFGVECLTTNLNHVSLLEAGAVTLGLVALSLGAAAAEWQRLESPLEALGLSWGGVLVGFVLAWVYLWLMFRAQPSREFLWAEMVFVLCAWWWLVCESPLDLSHSVATGLFALLLALLTVIPNAVEELDGALAQPGAQATPPPLRRGETGGVDSRMTSPSPSFAKRGVAFSSSDLCQVLDGTVLVMAGLALLLTHGLIEPKTVVTLFLTSGAFTLATAAQRRPGLVYASGGALQLGLFYLLFWKALQTTQGGGGASNPWEIASYVAAFAAVPMVLFSGVATWLEGRGLTGLGSPPEDYAQPLRHLSFIQAAIAAVAVVGSWVNVPYPPAPVHIALCGLSLGLLAAFFFWQAARKRKEWPVYLGLLAFASGWFYARFAYGLPGRFDPWAMVVVGVALSGASQLFKGQPVFSRPLLFSSLILPLVPLGLLVLKGYTPTDQIGVPLTIALFYSVIWQQTRWQWTGVVFGLLMQIAFCLYWLHADVRLREHFQYYLIPAGLLAILFAHVHRRELGATAANEIRWLAGAVIYLSSAVDLFSHHIALSHWTALIVLAVLGLLAGYALRLRVFFYLGTIFLIGNTATLLTHRAVTDPGWRALIIATVALTLIGCGAFWSKLWEGWRELTEGLEE